MRHINVGVIGAGWCGGIRAVVAAKSPVVDAVHLAEIRPDRLADVAAQTDAATATTDYRELLANDRIDAIVIAATPETTHYPMAKHTLEAGKHLLLEKPIALTLEEADDLIGLARERGLKFTIGYSQRFNPKQAFARQQIQKGVLGEPVAVVISRHITRGLGDKIGSRIKLSPASMEATHDIDFALWSLAPARPVRVYAQAVERLMQPQYGVADHISIMITLNSGVVVTVGAGWVLPPNYPDYSSTWIEIIGTDGALFLDDTHRDVVLSTTRDGAVFPLSSMPGESIGHVFAGPMEQETTHFLAAVAFDRDVLVRPEEARLVMEVYMAADLSAERHEPVDLPLTRDVARMAEKATIRR